MLLREIKIDDKAVVALRLWVNGEKNISGADILVEIPELTDFLVTCSLNKWLEYRIPRSKRELTLERINHCCEKGTGLVVVP